MDATRAPDHRERPSGRWQPRPAQPRSGRKHLLNRHLGAPKGSTSRALDAARSHVQESRRPGDGTRSQPRRYVRRRDPVRRHPLPAPLRGGQPDPAGDHRLLVQPVHLLRHVPGEAFPRASHGGAGPGDRLGPPAPGRRPQGLPRRRRRPRRQDALPLRAARPPPRGLPRPATRLGLRLTPVHRDPHRRGPPPAAGGGADPALPRGGVRRRRGAHLARQGRRRRGHDPPGAQGLRRGHEALHHDPAGRR